MCKFPSNIAKRVPSSLWLNPPPPVFLSTVFFTSCHPSSCVVPKTIFPLLSCPIHSFIHLFIPRNLFPLPSSVLSVAYCRTESPDGLLLLSPPTARDIDIDIDIDICSQDDARPSSGSPRALRLFSSSSSCSSRRPLPGQGSAFVAAACFRGGSAAVDGDAEISAEDALAAVAVGGITGGTKKGALLLDHVRSWRGVASVHYCTIE